jgi:hypothetical protein
MPKAVHQMTVAQFEKAFPDEEACRKYLIARRWPRGVHCPRCGNAKVTALKSGYHWQCYECANETSYRFSHIAGRFLRTRTSRCVIGFVVTHKMLTSKKGISALQIKRDHGFRLLQNRLVHVPSHSHRVG